MAVRESLMGSPEEDQNDGLERRRSTGKWRQAGVPHKGWVYAGDVEHNSDGEICQMCEVREIKWVHPVVHADYSEVLRVGCVCAGNLTRDYEQPEPEPGVVDASMVAAQQREKEARNAEARRKTAKKRREEAAVREEEQRIQALVNQAVAEIAAEKQREQAAIKEEERLRRAAIDLENRRAAWPSQVWSLSKNGNETVLEDGFRLTVFRKGNGWSGVVNRLGSKARFLKKFHGTSDSAKLALFDYMIWLKDRNK
jgi:flagellar biosynthesis GTPase FlhF